MPRRGRLQGYRMLWVLLLAVWCDGSPVQHPPTLFEAGQVIAHVHAPQLDEISGLAVSRRHDDVLYVHNDSGGRPRIYAISAINGTLLATFIIEGATSCDWEDVAVGGGPGADTYIYIADTGGNSVSTCNRVYRVREPDILEGGVLPVDATYEFSWDEPDCETLLADSSGNVYLVSKVPPGSTPRLYDLPQKGWDATERTVLNDGSVINITLFAKGPTAGDLSPNGQEVLLKTYNAVYYWRLGAKPGNVSRHAKGQAIKSRIKEDIFEALQRAPHRVCYIPETQGEAICWDSQAVGFYTLGEGTNQPLLYHRRTTDENRPVAADNNRN